MTPAYLPSLYVHSFLPVFGVERERPLRQGREVDDTVDHGGRAGDLRAGVELPDLLAGRRVERVEVLVVGADQDALLARPPVTRRRSCRSHATSGAFRSSRRTSRPCRRSSRCRRGRTRRPASSRRCPAARAAPAPMPRQICLPVFAFSAVDVVVVRAEEHAAVRVGDRALDGAARLDVPEQRPVCCVERVDVAAPVADVDAPLDDERRRLARAEREAPALLAVARRAARRAARPACRRTRCTAACSGTPRRRCSRRAPARRPSTARTTCPVHRPEAAVDREQAAVVRLRRTGAGSRAPAGTRSSFFALYVQTARNGGSMPSPSSQRRRSLSKP